MPICVKTTLPVLNVFVYAEILAIYEFEYSQDGDVVLTHVGTEDIIADVLTKALVGEQFRKFTIALLDMS